MKTNKDNLGNRMKGYEIVSQNSFVKRMPLIIRLDGKAFHTYTKPFKDKNALDPFSQVLNDTMVYTMEQLCKEIQNAVFAYTQSDEISILLNDWKELNTDQWFGNTQNKIESVSASLATGHFNSCRPLTVNNTESPNIAFFDARAFNVPKEDVANYFIWRQQDAVRNSIQMMGQHHFSHKSLNGQNLATVRSRLIKEKGLNWEDLATWKKRGACWFDKTTDREIPIFSEQRDYIEDHLLTNLGKTIKEMEDSVKHISEDEEDLENSWTSHDDEDIGPPSSW